MFALDPDDLDARETLAAASEMRDLQAEAEVAELRLGLRFVDLHPDPTSLSDGPGIPGGERGVVYGGDGCPAVAEFAAAEFGAVTGRSAPAAARFLGEALGLRHRLPLTYAQMLSGHAAPWKARKIAAACMELSFEAAAIVDQRVAAIIDSVTPLRLANIVRAAMWQADPDTARAVAEARARTRGVWAVRTDDHGTTMLFVRASTGNVIRLKATLTQIADALAVLGDTDSLDQRRAKAIGVIADPALADKLLQVAHHLTTTRNTDTEAGTAPGIGTETGTETGIGTKADTSTGTGTSTDIGASTGIGTCTGTGTGIGTNASTNAGTNAGTEVGTEAEIPAVPEDLAGQRPVAPTVPTLHSAPALTPQMHNAKPEPAQQLGTSGRDRDTLVGVAIGVPGPIDLETGVVGPSLPGQAWAGVNVADQFRKHLAVPVLVENNTRLEAVAEFTWGAGRGARDVLYVGLSTGIGSGLLVDGELHRGGARGGGGEVGHISAQTDGAACPCGNHGCLVQYASIPAVLAALAPTLGAEAGVDDVLAASAAGDPDCQRVLSDAGEQVGRVLANICNLLNPERIIIGGELARAGEVLIEPLRATLRRSAMALTRDVDVVAAELDLGARAGASGAAALVLRQTDQLVSALLAGASTQSNEAV